MSSIAIEYHWLSFAVKQIVSINYLPIIPAIRPALVLHVVVFYCPGLLPLIREISNMFLVILTVNQVVVKGIMNALSQLKLASDSSLRRRGEIAAMC